MGDGNSPRRATGDRGPAPVQCSGWQAGFHAALLNYIVRHGELVSLGFRDYSYAQWQELGPWDDEVIRTLPHPLAVHVLDDCAIDPARSSYEDSEWTEFEGSLDGHGRQAGLDAVIYCRCGQVDGRHWRYTDGYAELMRGITGS